MAKPNILMIMADQLAADWVACWDVAPHLDAAQMYVRSHDGQETNQRMRVPRVDT